MATKIEYTIYSTAAICNIHRAHSTHIMYVRGGVHWQNLLLVLCVVHHVHTRIIRERSMREQRVYRRSGGEGARVTHTYNYP